MINSLAAFVNFFRTNAVREEKYGEGEEKGICFLNRQTEPVGDGFINYGAVIFIKTVVATALKRLQYAKSHFFGTLSFY